jgi:hypothetical protein
MELVSIKKLIDKSIDEIHEGMEVISAIGNRGKIIQKTNTTKNKNDFWIKILWENGRESFGPWTDKDRWCRVTLA